MKRHMLGLTGVVFALALLLTSAAGAAPANQTTVVATADTYLTG